jgi:hypothetical protein
MRSCVETLVARAKDICGTIARAGEIRELRMLAPKAAIDLLASIYESFPVSGMRVVFCTDMAGRVRAPCKGDEEADGYHQFYWATPSQIADEMNNSRPGPSIQAAGYVLIGLSVFGGDPYFIRAHDKAPSDAVLYRVYYDWIDPDDPTPIVPEATALVATRLSDVLLRAQFLSA